MQNYFEQPFHLIGERKGKGVCVAYCDGEYRRLSLVVSGQTLFFVVLVNDIA